MPSRVIFQLPTKPTRLIALPHLSGLPPPGGRRLPNGTIVAEPDDAPAHFYKFTRWSRSSLAFNEADIHAHIGAPGGIPGIVRLLGISGTEEHFVRVLERSRRGTLDRFLRDETGDAMGPGCARTLLAEIAATLATLHSLDIVHRDIKAENILVFDTERQGDDRSVAPKISDFDRAIILPPGAVLDEPVGSLFHMAPELLARQPYDRKVDVYAFGILMFEVVHRGARAYTNVATAMPGSISRAEFADKVIEGSYRPEWRHENEVLWKLAAQCWSADPRDRPEFWEIAGFLAEAERPARNCHKLLTARPVADRTGIGIGSFGLASTTGEIRPQMEDAACVLATPGRLIACVFDGLRGHRSSEFAARRLAVALAAGLENGAEDPEDAIWRAFETTEAALGAIEPSPRCGSTATLALLLEHTLLLAWLGDSPAYLIGRDEHGELSCKPLIRPHHPGREGEAARAIAHGGIIAREQHLLDSGEAVPWGPLRVFAPGSARDGARSGGVALSRAFGLPSCKPAVSGEPELIRLDRREDDLFLILGTDGVFEVLDGAAASEIAMAAASPQQAADAIIAAVSARGAPDNASVIVIDLATFRRAGRT